MLDPKIDANGYMDAIGFSYLNPHTISLPIELWSLKQISKLMEKLESKKKPHFKTTPLL